MANRKKPFWERITHYEPHLTMGQWFLDRIANNWPWFWPTVGGLIVYRLAEVSALLKPFGPIGWAALAILGAFFFAVIRVLFIWGTRIRVRNRYDAQMLSGGADFNPLDKTFVGKRIFVNDFVLPSHPLIEAKTFIDCDIIGPANLYWHLNNAANPIRPPVIDTVVLDPNKLFNSGFILRNCSFTNCSFQRITMFIGVPDYQSWKGNTNINIISIPPNAIAAAVATPLAIENNSTDAS